MQATVCKAKDKLNELLLKEDSRHDSGLDLDLSSSDLHISELNQTHTRQIVQHDTNKNGVLNNSSNSQCHSKRPKVHKSGFPKWNWFRMKKQYLKPFTDRKKKKHRSAHHRQRGSPRRDYFPKGSEYTGYPDYSPYLSGRIRDSISDIAHHMDLMDNLTNRLHSSITMDMVRYRHVTSRRDPPLPYGDYCYPSYQAGGSLPFNYYPGFRVPYIAGSIVDSYNMERDSDTVSYVSNHLSSTSRSKHKLNDAIQNGDIVTSEEPGAAANSSDIITSRDNLLPREQIYTLENDMYYPTTTSSSDVSSPSRQQRQSHKSGRRIRKHQRSKLKYKNHQNHRLYPHPELSPEQQSTFNISFV